MGGKVVRLWKGDFDRVTLYEENPLTMLRRWGEQGADIVHVVDLDGARTGTPRTELWNNLAATHTPCQIGGGIRSREGIEAALETGAKRVVLGSVLLEQPEIISGFPHPGKLVAAVDIMDGRAWGQGWTDPGQPYPEVLNRLTGLGLSRFLVTSIKTDGTMRGPDLALYQDIRQGWPKIKLIASGGVAWISQLAQLAKLGVEATIVGRALYENRFNLVDANRAIAAFYRMIGKRDSVQ